MYGAILGDMIGALYEFDRGNKTKEFPIKEAQIPGTYGAEGRGHDDQRRGIRSRKGPRARV